MTLELLEGRGIPGGKVSSWRERDGDWIESGLHVFFGAYDEIFKLMHELGIYENILWKEHALIYTLDNGERFAFLNRRSTQPLPPRPGSIWSKILHTAANADAGTCNAIYRLWQMKNIIKSRIRLPMRNGIFNTV